MADKPFSALPKELDKLGGRLRKPLRKSMSAVSRDGKQRLKQSLKSALRRAKQNRSGKKPRWRPTGTLQKSIRNSRVKTLKSNPDALWVGFGVVSMERPDNQPKGSQSKGTAAKVSTSRYAYLLESGHKGPIKAKAYPFLKPVVKKFGSKAKRAIRDALKQGLK